MSNRNYLAGRRWEYKVMKDLRDRGFITMRTAGSHGPFDIIAISEDNEYAVWMIQCKVVSEQSAANRIIKAFTKNPPLGRKTHDVLQSIEVWNKGNKRRHVGVAI